MRSCRRSIRPNSPSSATFIACSTAALGCKGVGSGARTGPCSDYTCGAMRILLLADIHSNLTALQTVVKDAHDRGPVDAIWSLGDQVGYGPDPVACLKLLKESGAVCIAGNHDA